MNRSSHRRARLHPDIEAKIAPGRRDRPATRGDSDLEEFRGPTLPQIDREHSGARGRLRSTGQTSRIFSRDWIHIVSTGNDGVKQSQVLRIKTKDFVNFEDPQTILGINDNNFATLIESPAIYHRKGIWYLLFTYAHRRYTETIVVVSDNPDHFDYENNVLTTLFGHAAKIFSYKGKEYISSCGPEDRNYYKYQSVTLAELGWTDQISQIK